MHITDHARQRYKRTGLPKRTIDNVVELAYTQGVTRHDCNGKLRRYVDSLRLGRKRTHVRLYNNFVWIFGDNALVTLYAIPSEYQVQAAKLLRRKKNED